MSDAKHTPTPWELWQCGDDEWMLASVRHGKLIVLQAVRHGMQGATFRVRDHETCVMHKITEQDVQGHPDLLFLLRAANCHDDLLAACEDAQFVLGKMLDRDITTWERGVGLHGRLFDAIAKAKPKGGGA